jgi:hypothetical protein
LQGPSCSPPPQSAWAEKFYDPELLERAKQPLREQRKPVTFASWSAGVAALICLVGLFAARPAPILGLDGHSIGNSLPNRGGGAFFSLWPPLGPCRQVDGDIWNCAIYDDEGSGGTVDHRVKVGSIGCWNATPTGPGGRGALSGCLTILDYLE